MLRMQNEFLTNFRIVPVFGITPQALLHVISVDYDDGTTRQMTLQNFILAKPSILGLKTTNRAADLGKLFLISNAAGILDTQSFVDTVLKELYESPYTPLNSSTQTSIHHTEVTHVPVLCDSLSQK
jgi:hypothetical protein